MKTAAFLLCAIAGGLAAAGAAPQVADVKSVYLLPMTGGLDQYLASRLSSEGVFQVVVDPQKADAIFTDRLGESLERRLSELYPPPKAAEPEAEAEAKAEEKKAEEPKTLQEIRKSRRERDMEIKEKDARPPVSSFSRARGTIFLVDAKTRSVLWSTYQRPRNTTPAELDKVARTITERLRKGSKAK